MMIINCKIMATKEVTINVLLPVIILSIKKKMLLNSLLMSVEILRYVQRI